MTATFTPVSGSPAVDRVVAFNPGPGPQRNYLDPEAALDTPDLIESPCCTGMVQLGRGGSLLLAFVDNTIVDGDGPDFQIVGESAGDDHILVEVSNDGREWYTYPKVTESSQGLELGDSGLEQAVYVRLTDVQPGTPSGAEIDAVVALSSGPALWEPLPDLPDAVARDGTVLREGPDRRMAEVSAVEAGTNLTLRGRGLLTGWLKVETESGVAGWCSASSLAINVSAGTYPVVESPPTPTPEQPTSAPAGSPRIEIPDSNIWIVFERLILEERGWPNQILVWTSLGKFKVNIATLETVSLDERATFTRWEYYLVDPRGQWTAESSAKNRNDGATELYVRRSDGSGEFKLVGEPLLHVELAGWSPDGQWLAFRARQGTALGVANVQTREVRVLAECPFPAAAGAVALRKFGCISRLPIWLPGGEFIAFSLWMDDDGGGDIDPQYDSSDLFLAARDGSMLRNLTNTPGVSDGWALAPVLGWIEQ